VSKIQWPDGRRRAAARGLSLTDDSGADVRWGYVPARSSDGRSACPCPEMSDGRLASPEPSALQSSSPTGWLSASMTVGLLASEGSTADERAWASSPDQHPAFPPRAPVSTWRLSSRRVGGPDRALRCRVRRRSGAAGRCRESTAAAASANSRGSARTALCNSPPARRYPSRPSAATGDAAPCHRRKPGIARDRSPARSANPRSSQGEPSAKTLVLRLLG
jgi:hypothetical protein